MLSGKTVGFYEAFYDHTGKFIGQFPPAHPHCRCTIFYREILPPGLDDLTPEAMTSPNTPPYLLGKLDPSNTAAVAEAISHYEGLIVEQPIENAIVITTDGEVYHVTGDEEFIHPLADLDNKLNSAIVTHNHPIDSANQNSFSDADLNLFMNYGIERLHGIDEYFLYELNRNPNDIDDGNITIEDVINDETGTLQYHAYVIERALQIGIGYRRWKR